MKLGVLDYGAGNLRSVLNAFEAIGAHANLVTKPEDFDGIDVLVFPGQGAFGDSVRILKETGLWEPLRAWLKAEKPYLGICLGYQLLFESSEECPGVEGLVRSGWQGAQIRCGERFEDPAHGLERRAVGNESVSGLGGLPNPTYIYFVHSYYPEVQDESLALCRTDYGVSFISGIAKKNLVAVQFHPEKSQEAGLTLLRNALKVLEQ
jgi:glutamine amidotransferase